MFEQHRNRLGTPEKREVSQIVFPNVEEALAARGRIASGTVVRRPRQGARSQSVRRRSRHDRKIRDPRSRRSRTPRSRCRPARSASRCRAGSAWRWSRSARSSPGSTPTYESVAAQSEEGNRGRARAQAKVAELHNKMEDERGGGASVVEAAQKLGPDRRHHRGRRPFRPHAQRPARDQHPARARRGVAGLQQRRRRRQRSDLSSTAAMSGTTCSASRPRASAISTRSRTRSRRAGARTRSRAKLRTKATEMVQKLDQGGNARRGSGRDRIEGRNRQRLPSATPRCPACPQA